jgi:hypothetical protein
MMRVTIHQPQFLPWLGYLDKIDQTDRFIVLDNVQFKKNEWQNRNRIRTAQGWQWLTVPVLHDFGQLLRDVRINPTAHWKDQHLRALEMHYAKAPFRDRYLGDLTMLYREPWERLSDLNVAVVRWLLGAFGIQTPISLASEYASREDATERLIDLCRAVGATRYLAGAGAEDYMNKQQFEASGLILEVQAFRHPVYRQCYEPFTPGMAAVDLLFTCGPQALQVLRMFRAGIVMESVA